MNFAQAENELDALAISRIGLLNCGCEISDAAHARVGVAAHFDLESENLWTMIENKEISLTEYRERWVELIDRYCTVQFCQRVENKLLTIRDAKQKEAQSADDN